MAIKNSVKKAISITAFSVLAGVLLPMNVQAVECHWEIVDGNWYWYEDGVKQGTEGRGKEIFDPSSNAWYWLDAVDGGKKAVSKDLYQESEAGPWAELEDGTGKWVRYDANGHMIKGWDTNETGTYYFDLTYGTMAKGNVEIDGKPCAFDAVTGVGKNNTWLVLDGVEYWYENGVRQGLDGRGKEIFDASSNAWYWLDSVDNGKKAVNKDVYQESQADDAGNIGKWVRYDANGHMIKGWNDKDGNRYYFDPVYGTMAKGEKVIDGVTYLFHEQTGILEGKKEEPQPDNNDQNNNQEEKEDISYLEYQVNYKTKTVEIKGLKDTANVTSIRIPAQIKSNGVVCNVTSIANYAFYECNTLTSVVIEDGVTSIGNFAFGKCSSLTDIKIPDSVTQIGTSAFRDCDALESIKLPSQITSISDSVFYDCDGLKRIEIPNKVTSIGNEVFSKCDALKSVSIPNSVTSIGEAIFYDCDALSSVAIPNTVTSIKDSAFWDCDALVRVEIPNSITSIGNYAFYDCDMLTNVVIPNSVTSIGEYAFSRCDNLVSLEIPNSVIKIGSFAFGYIPHITYYGTATGSPWGAKAMN